MNQRLLSLDAFRGFTIAAMLLVNNPGDWGHLYGPLAHAKWDGWTFTDWVFPFFVFISGISMTLSLGRRAALGDHKPSLLLQTIKRGAIIILIGLLLNLIPSFNFSDVRIPGVLQRLGLCTILAAPIVLYCNWRQQLGCFIGLLLVYTVVMLVVPVPDAMGVWHTSSLLPGEDAGAWLDRTLMDGHLWRSSETWDPDGLLSTVPAVAGSGVGAWSMPINKSLWTPAYTVFMAGWACIVFGTFYWLLDAVPDAALRVRVARLAHPLVVFGMNALFIFLLSGLIAKMLGFIKLETAFSLKAWLYAPLQATGLAPVNTSLMFALAFTAVMYAIAWGMWRKAWFVKV